MSTNTQPICNAERSKPEAGATNLLRRGLALALAYLMIPIGIGDVYAQNYEQQAPPPPPDQYGQQYSPQYGQPQQSGYYEPLSPDQLDQLVAPIALYPDALVAQVLAAATYPAEVANADQWMQSYESYPPQEIAQMANGMQWDPSVKSLTAFPSVLDNMARNMDWTTQLGNAYYNQPQDVMEAVQAMRQQAYDSGYLRSTPQMDVSYSPEYIEIAPANPDVVYVPYYNPWNVYGPVINPWYQYYVPPPPRGVYISGIGLGFGIGIAIVSFSHWGWGWGHWHPDWRNREVYYGHDQYVSRSQTVYNRGHFGGYDRTYARTAFRRDNNGHAQGYRPAQQFRGRGNANFQQQNREQQNFNHQQQNFNRQQQILNRNQQNLNREQQNLRQQQNREQQNFNRQQQNLNRNRQQFNRPQQNFNREQQNREQQNFNHQQQNLNRNQQQFNREQHPQNVRPQNNERRQVHPQPHSRPAEHPHSNSGDHGHGHRR